ncbi:hypothetical protein J6590_034082 [Homalodisca vitripennis]|nr:hypothetical protein J6590_034082 [Homalodisca vitripennis]
MEKNPLADVLTSPIYQVAGTSSPLVDGPGLELRIESDLLGNDAALSLTYFKYLGKNFTGDKYRIQRPVEGRRHSGVGQCEIRAGCSANRQSFGNDNPELDLLKAARIKSIIGLEHNPEIRHRRLVSGFTFSVFMYLSSLSHSYSLNKFEVSQFSFVILEFYDFDFTTSTREHFQLKGEKTINVQENSNCS